MCYTQCVTQGVATMKKTIIKEPEVKSEPYDPRVFKPITQTTTVNITIEEKDDGIAECIGGCFRACLGIAKNAK
jgi:hypothetical protein